MIGSVLAVISGAFFGGILRWVLGHRPGGTAGTWVANALGCTVLGFSAGLSTPVSLLAGTGFAGALSTWSTLARELGQMLQQRRWAALTAYALATIAGGIGCVMLGLGAARVAYG